MTSAETGSTHIMLVGTTFNATTNLPAPRWGCFRWDPEAHVLTDAQFVEAEFGSYDGEGCPRDSVELAAGDFTYTYWATAAATAYSDGVTHQREAASPLLVRDAGLASLRQNQAGEVYPLWLDANMVGAPLFGGWSYGDSTDSLTGLSPSPVWTGPDHPVTEQTWMLFEGRSYLNDHDWRRRRTRVLRVSRRDLRAALGSREARGRDLAYRDRRRRD